MTCAARAAAAPAGLVAAARGWLPALAGAIAYGASLGAGKNWTYVWRSAVKFPLLLVGTALVCGLACHVAARFTGARLSFGDVQRGTWSLFATLAVLLGSLSPATTFLALTMPPPVGDALGGYPAFVGVNVALVAAAGAVATVLQVRRLRALGVAAAPARAVVASWLVLALLVGGQAAFWLRPFFGIASLTGAPPFALGDEPTATGARNFYEAVWQFVGERNLMLRRRG